MSKTLTIKVYDAIERRFRILKEAGIKDLQIFDAMEDISSRYGLLARDIYAAWLKEEKEGGEA